MRKREFDILAVIAIGGALGSVARYGLSVAIPHARGDFAVSTLVINVVGCLLIGVLMGVITAMREPHRLLRPFLGIGILGGFTTFSTYIVDTLDSAGTGHPLIALEYALGSVASGLLAVALGLGAARLRLKKGPVR
jgi:CrcB protein